LSVPDWLPPLNAMGGPAPHVLYRELAMLDGINRRVFGVPSPELTAAFDRFRMRRGQRPASSKDVEEVVRLILARMMDPDVKFESLTATATGFVEPHFRFLSPTRIEAIASPHRSGAFAVAEPFDDTLARYTAMFRDLVQNGGWIGTTEEISQRIGEEPGVVVNRILQHRSALSGHGIMIAPVPVDTGWRWLAVDRTRLTGSPRPKPLAP
jgi:hypothetical protein